MFFANQVVPNACATQAILSILLNLKDETEINIGSTLKDLKQFTSDFDPYLRGVVIGESETIRQAHNSFSRPEALYFDSSDKDQDGPKEDPFHFISIIPVNGQLLEFDGLKEAPVIIKEDLSDCDWRKIALDYIKSKIEMAQSSSPSEIRFNLMAAVQDPVVHLKHMLQGPITEDDPLYSEIKEALARENDRKEARKRENKLKRHNFVPLVMAMLESLARKGELAKYC